MNALDGRRLTSVLLGLGSNVGDRRGNIASALALFARDIGVAWRRVSRLYETEPVGGPPQRRFLNAVGEVESDLAPLEILAAAQRVEERLGRVRRARNGERTIDVDILTYGTDVFDSLHLVVPHPRMLERLFVLAPLVEVAPGRIHPRTGKSFSWHLRDLASRAGHSGSAER